MPGQRKRKRQRERERERAVDRFAPGAGHWEVLFETQDEAAWLAYVARLRATRPDLDWSATRVDVLCGRLVNPTTHRLSHFVPNEGDEDRGAVV
ncbi:hypothetical protein ACFWXK_27195 [Streptomyces sp. NPDC059070]|uniref:hypothetical protein n=1 Tax=unclassified Streptomyces TaxID=2593676 RepID=UPI0034E1D2EB